MTELFWCEDENNEIISTHCPIPPTYSPWRLIILLDDNTTADSTSIASGQYARLRSCWQSLDIFVLFGEGDVCGYVDERGARGRR